MKHVIYPSAHVPGGVRSRTALVASALWLSYFTIAWNGVVGALALLVSSITGSLVLAGFALNALLDASASSILVWRFRRERSDRAAAERLERQAQAFVAIAMLFIAVYVGTQAVQALVDGSHADKSALGVILAIASLFVLPWLGRRKLHLAAALPSRALRGDGVLTIAAAALAAITLLALFLTSALGWWWADPLAALIIVVALAVDAMRLASHRFGPTQ